MLAKEEKNLELTKVVPFQIFLLVPAISCLPSLAIDLAILTSFLLCHLIHFLCSISHCCCRPSTKELQLSRSKKLRNAGTAKRERNKETMVSFFFFFASALLAPIFSLLLLSGVECGQIISSVILIHHFLSQTNPYNRYLYVFFKA